ncbi:hypothetical protein F9L33_08210 [Amylibacter sp. SFDW26]|uniref:hypothetical protein n=1 Tax=Amylibacter sp. SFDW26 TaxID=2652722 RepID=UPI001261CB31|nr:hypothetical protein [Amylibacter sp. SFDW26]KAB7614610.1 hypothetical protein F9L33_08210 [Amylibacter sp. SFDW26]
MLNAATLTRKRIHNGVYEGVYQGRSNETAAPILSLIHLGESVGEVFADQINTDNNTWLIRCRIPVNIISDGLQTFFICTEDTTAIDNFSIASGEVLDDELRNEINLLREELDMLKRAFRRHCAETMG